MEKLLTSKETAEVLGVKEQTLKYTLCANGDLPYVKILNKWRFRREDVEDYINKRTVQNVYCVKKVKKINSNKKQYVY